MSKKNLFYPILLLILSACNNGTDENENLAENTNETEEIIVELDTTPVFIPIESNFETTGIILPEGFTYTVLFSEGDPVTREDGQKFPAKGLHDLTVFIPDEKSPNTKGWVYISHEEKRSHDGLGDGGGGTMFEIELIENEWKVISDFVHIDFAPVGYTNRNCGGSLTPNGTIFTCEESWSNNTEYVYMGGKGLRDTSWVNGRPAWQNMGFVVEVDPKTKKVIRKHYQMGKFVHEDAHCTADGKYVYLTDDNNPGGFYRFQTDKPFDYNKGQLFVYKQSEDGESGDWLALPRDSNSMYNTTNVALSLGSTMFIRHEWVEEINGKLYICETGDDDYNYTQSKKKGGNYTNYAIKNLKVEGDNNFKDPFGRILEFDPKTNKMSVYLEGGMMKDGINCFSNPDCNTSVTIKGKTYLVMSEDLIGLGKGRVPDETKNYINEIYFLDMSIKNPTVDDLLRFAVAPMGSETTGVVFTPDGKNMIVNIQHPKTSNPAPFNKSCTIIIQGF